MELFVRGRWGIWLFNLCGSAGTKWREDVTYDANGNILTYFRNGNTSTMDNLSYVYNTGNNQLKRVDDAVSSGTYSVDIDDQSGTNYEYDALGNLVKDVAEEIDTILWTLTGKVDSISRTGASTKDELSFLYDPMGNRVGKIVYEDDGDIQKTWYIRDAQGNIMSTYTEKEDSLWWTEIDLYGSSRLGVIYPDSLVYPFTYTMPGDTFSFFNIAGNRRYEITNHLGNVLATITDRRIPQEVGTPDGIAEYYLSDIASVQDYYPFGMVTPGRAFSAGDGYRFGFNGQENLEEITESSTYYSFDYRVHDSRLGRFLSVDPLSKSFPWNSPYAFAENRVIDGIDLEGAEHYYYWIKITFTNGKPLLELEYFNTMETIPWPFETIVGDITIDFPAPGPLYVISFGFFNYFFSTEDEMRQAVDDLQQTFDYAEFLECHCMTNLPEEFTLEFYERQAEGWINFYNMLGGAMGGIMMRAVTIKAPTPRKISTSKMYREGSHYSKHGKNMGYKSKKGYRKAAHKFLSDNQSNEAAVITDGIWTGKGTNNGRLQRAIQVDNKTAIFDVESGDIIDFYDGTGLGQKFKVVETY